MISRNDRALLILLLSLGICTQGVAAEMTGVTAALCSSDNTRCLRIHADRSSQSHFVNIFTFGKAVVEHVKGPLAGQIQYGMVTLDLVHQKMTIFQRLNAPTAKEIQFDLKTLDQKEFLVD